MCLPCLRVLELANLPKGEPPVRQTWNWKLWSVHFILGCKVYTTARNQEQAKTTEQDIRQKSKSELVHCLVCELDKFSSVKGFVAAFKKSKLFYTYSIII